MLFYQLVVGNLYAGGLAAVMTRTRYDAPIDSVDRLINSGVDWGFNSLDFAFSIERTEDATLRRFLDGYQICTIEECGRRAKALNLALFVEQLQYG